MKCVLRERQRSDDLVVLAAELPPSAHPLALRYRTELGAVVRANGRLAGAFDREHDVVALPAHGEALALTLEVERRSLPTNGLPPGPGVRWSLLLARARAEPERRLEIEAAEPPLPHAWGGSLALWGHGHLDVAWLWTYAQARRKAVRTFANALALMEQDRGFVFVQSQPQLYEFVREADAEFFERVAARVRDGRFDASVAALWVEPDCNVPSGESLLRQMLYAHRYCVERFGIEPSIAWLPDTFGFARTLPTLLAHAGIGCFATTKLQWNDTTRFPYPQFCWRGPDGSEVLAASIDRMEGDATGARVRIASDRGEPLIVGYGDGGGGPTARQVREAASAGSWEPATAWFARLGARRAELPVHDDELYLEYHRGTYTTHHDVKAGNAALERKLAWAETLAAWCVAVRAPRAALDRVRGALHGAWEIVLRNQFHDVLPGTSIAEVYADVREEHARANVLADEAAAAARALLPRAAPPRSAPLRPPDATSEGFEFGNGFVEARVLPNGTLTDLRVAGGGNAVAQANLLAHYPDRPKKWEAWNIDAGYERRRRAAVPGAAKLVDGGLEVPFRIGRRSLATMRLTLREGDPYLRVELAVDWRERRTLLRLENWLAVRAEEAIYGAPHGTVTRSARADTAQRRARFEVPGQRFALVRDGEGTGVALFSLDAYGWSARALAKGGVRLGHSLLRSTGWPDPRADAGEAAFAWAFAPVRGAGVGAVESAWRRFAGDEGVPLFESGDDAIAVVACKPAHDGDGVIVRIRECDGAARPFALRCGGRMREAIPVDGVERRVPGDARIEGESLAGEIAAYALRSWRVRF